MLDAVAENWKRLRCDPAKQFDLSPNGKRRKKIDGVANEVVQVKVFKFKGRLFQEAAHG